MIDTKVLKQVEQEIDKLLENITDEEILAWCDSKIKTLKQSKTTTPNKIQHTINYPVRIGRKNDLAIVDANGIHIATANNFMNAILIVDKLNK